MTIYKRHRIKSLLMLIVFLLLLGCDQKVTGKSLNKRTYWLALGNEIKLDVDYKTKNITTDSANYKVIISFFNKEAKSVIAVDCSLLGGGLIKGKFQAYLNKDKGEQGEFSCLYQHTSEVLLNTTADVVKISDLHFIHTIE
jgi:hypothetical protein